MPMAGWPLAIEPRYPKAKALMAIGAEPEEPEDPNVKHRNTFWSTRHRCDVMVYEEGGRVKKVVAGRSNPIDLLIGTMDCSHAWGIEQEARAVDMLGKLLKHHQFKMYLLTGAFTESGRSGTAYIFRRLRPTIALQKVPANDTIRFLAALCMHPIAFYRGTWAGGMCPTDDVIAHLTMMRADEHFYWRRCNQHPMHAREAGL